MISQNIITKDDLQYLCDTAKKDNYEFRERRHDNWTENYTLYRDKVQTNRLTQTQSVNIPLMKQTIKTLLSKVDDFVVLDFKNNDNDEQKEIYYNAYWEKIVENEKLEIKDVVSKKNVMLYGRSFKQLNVVDGEIKIKIIDPFDISVDRFLDPTDIDSAKSLVHSNIYTVMADLELNEMYDKKVLNELKEYFESEQGLIKASENEEQYIDKQERLSDLGDDYAFNPQIGRTVVSLDYVFVKVWNPENKAEEIIFNVLAEGKIIYSEFLETVIGVTPDHYWRNHYPYTSWGDDIENTDFWSDAVADSIRVPNKVLNSWFSQLVMNRTLRNLGMVYYDSTLGAGSPDSQFVPQTWEPKAFGFYPVNGDPNKVLKNVEVPQLIGNLEDMNFIMQIAERASSATAITQGVSEQKKITLGEVEILAGNAQERIQSMSKFYIEDWKQTGIKYTKLLEASGESIKSYQIFKKGYRGNMFGVEISPNDWMSKSGYTVEVTTLEDKKTKGAEQLQNINSAKQFFVGNAKLDSLFKKKMLSISGLDPQEISEVMGEEEKMIEAQQNMMMQGQLPQGQPMPQQNVLPNPQQADIQQLKAKAQSLLA